ncbi:MAG TPA: hypothetical protein PK361_07455 [Chiayiivirga sp.]|nr:hypothetical protein [Chiayiivirga sp.]HRQ35432.1 hypothetical protein [Chiayiivirga sp.]
MFLADVVEPSRAQAAARPERPVRVAALRSGAADHLITRDKDLLVLAGRYPILTPSRFRARHGR